MFIVALIAMFTTMEVIAINTAAMHHPIVKPSSGQFATHMTDTDQKVTIVSARHV